MNPTLYLPRKVSDERKIYTESELLAASNYIVILAEPGGGKSELMESLARQLGTIGVTANVFKHIGTDVKNCPLVIDAFDELAKIDHEGIYSLLATARKANPTYVIISSRSSEWESGATNAFKDCIGRIPLIVRLCEFESIEQRAIFEHHTNGESFDEFHDEVARFDLDALLPNPQFLKLFADAYIESGRSFEDKRSIFKLAIERLAKEENISVGGIKSTLTPEQKINLSSELFAKLLLSGTEGIGTNTATASRMYPLLASMLNGGSSAYDILATRLFKLGDSTDHHRPVHKIVAEYCAAEYLANRISDPADFLSLSTCLPVIAPNSIVRDELRGLLGWMASIGNKLIADAAIDLDPYAVLANGDPSQLEDSSKLLLLARLKVAESEDPYFRRGDYWRSFSAAGFFTQDVIKEIKPILAPGNDGHLRNLVLELLSNSPAIKYLTDELRNLALARDENQYVRIVAARFLLKITEYDHHNDLKMVIGEASNTSLNIAAEILEKIGAESFGSQYVSDFFRVCANLYPGHKERFDRAVGERYFVKRLIESLEVPFVEELLDELTKDLACRCGKKSYECDCRNGTSKIVGSLLDRYFELATPPFDPLRVWQWAGKLNFHEHKTPDQSIAAQVLQKDDALRQGIIAHVFSNLNDSDQISGVKLNLFDWHSHSGLSFRPNDYKFIVDLAFDTDNVVLWTSFLANHKFYRSKEDRGPDELRRHMREHALKKPLFMQAWARSNAVAVQRQREIHRLQRNGNRLMRRRRTNEANSHMSKLRFLNENRTLVESGRHLQSLYDFACLVLWEPENIEAKFGDENLVRNALRNCLDFMSPDVPDLSTLADLQCKSKVRYSEIILYAACLEIFRHKGSLEGIDNGLLRALRTNIHGYGSAVSTEEKDKMKAEIDRLIFPDSLTKMTFLQQYLEPQLEIENCIHPELWLLGNDETFSDLRADLSTDWLIRFSNLAFSPLDSLFEISAQYGNREKLKKVIAERCNYFLSNWPVLTGDDALEQKRTFWYLRSLYFLDDGNGKCWEWLKADKNTVLLLYNRSGRMIGRDHSYWPKLNSAKVEAILDAFFDQWPKVGLPSHHGSDSPEEENAYRFLTEVSWFIGSDDPNHAIPVLERLLEDPRYIDIRKDLKSILASQTRKKSLRDFEPPTHREIVELLGRGEVVTVEGLRQLLIEELKNFQKEINGGEFNSVNLFYEKDVRLNEVRSTEIIAERLHHKLGPKNISLEIEDQMKSANRSDFTATKMIGGRRRLLVTEVKGQWHKELYSAASAQLHDRYSIHPDAEKQGIYLVIWFGEDEEVAGRKNHGIKNSIELKAEIEGRLPLELKGLIDVFVLDVSRST